MSAGQRLCSWSAIASSPIRLSQRQLEDPGANTISNGHNIFGSDVVGNAPGDLENVPASLLFAGGLADNGGADPDHRLARRVGQPRPGRADPADAPATDQRGVARPQPVGTNPDIGAFELTRRAPCQCRIDRHRRATTSLRGTAGADVIRGRGGDDRLWGRAGDDALFGGVGCDVLAGGAGIDPMTGGAGRRPVSFSRQVEPRRPTARAYDEILDFSRAEHDRIDLRPIDARGGLPATRRSLHRPAGLHPRRPAPLRGHRRRRLPGQRQRRPRPRRRLRLRGAD